jgi:antitoxin CptB
VIGPDGDQELMRRRLRFRSAHRGNKEMDFILERFAGRYLEAFTGPQLQEYERILEIPDLDLYNWITGRAPVPANRLKGVLELLLKFDPSNVAS